MSARPLAWVLNLDVERELAAEGPYRTARSDVEVVARARAALRGGLVAPGDVVLDEDPDERARGLAGQAWCPTPSALARLSAVGALVPGAPPLSVLREVNARAFGVAVLRSLERPCLEKRIVRSAGELDALLARPADDGWLVRRPFGAAGRGRKRIRPGAVTEAERAWLTAGLRGDVLVVEPFARVTLELARHGWVRRSGDLVLGAPCVQEASEHGAWLGTRLAERSELGRGDDMALAEATARAGEALARAGYFGPYGVDAFRYDDGEREALQPLSEINARFTMGWSVGMGADSPLRDSRFN